MLKRIFLPTLATAVLISTASFAQAPTVAPNGHQAPPRGDFRPERGIQHRLQRLHERLAITPAQQPQWEAVVAALRENAVAMRGNPSWQAVRSGRLSAPQELRAVSDLAQQRADAMQRMVPPVDALYAALSPEQRQIADKAIDKAMRRGPGHRRG